MARHPVVIVQGETGCGKTTQLPQLCWKAGRGAAGMIALTQPRRIAARAVAARIAAELGSADGGLVAHQVRFEDRTSPRTRIKVVTDGILLAQLRSDRLLSKFDTVIVDEAHERSLNVDFLLGCLTRILHRRSDLKVIVASATIDAQRFSRHFGDAPIVEIPGRLHPVEVRHAEPVAAEGEEPDKIRAIVDAVSSLIDETDGDGLVFLPGEREIHEVKEVLSGRVKEIADVLPLYARLGAKEQDLALAGTGRRRVILATNVAETSLTVPRITFVVDSGDVRVLRYSPKARLQRLPIERVSKAGAAQRSGRCGRLGPGICVRLYSKEELAGLADWPQPEIQRVNLASVLLQMAAMDLGEVTHFPFLDAPSVRAVEEGRATLHELGALSLSGRLTRQGQQMARLPVDPRIARVLLESLRLHCLSEALVVAAALSVGDPRERPFERTGAADIAHLEWRDSASDLGSMLRLWRAWQQRQSELGSSALKRWCREKFLAHQRMREWQEIHRQLTRLVETHWDRAREGVRREIAEKPSLDALHKSLLAGFVSNVAQRTEEGEYELANGQKFSMHPSSVLARSSARWIVCAEIVDTGRRLGRTGVRIHPEWVEQVAPQLVKRSISEPHWMPERGQCAAWERVSLGTLVISPRRRVPLGPIDPAAARHHFIQGALIEELFQGEAPPFMARNRALRSAIEAEEARRRKPLLCDDLARHAFFDTRIPESIHSWPSFLRWLEEASRGQSGLLEMQRRDLLADPANDPDEGVESQTIDVGGVDRRVEFIHSPGARNDGATLRVPLAAASLIDPRALEWGTAGSLAERCEALIKSLPKGFRQRLIPAHEVAEGAAIALADRTGDLLPRLAEYCTATAGTRIAPEDFAPEKLEPHMRIRIEIFDEAGRTIDEDRDPRALCSRIRTRALGAFAELAQSFGDKYCRSRIDRWTPMTLPSDIPLSLAAPERSPVANVYPALVDREEWVDLASFPDELSARKAMRRGIVRLLALSCRARVAPHAEYHPKWEAIARLIRGHASGEREWLADIADAVAIDHVDRQPELPRSFEAMAALEVSLENTLWDLASTAVQRTHALLLGLNAARAASEGPLRKAILARIEAISPARPLRKLAVAQLSRAPRRLEALALRARKAMSRGMEWDEALAREFAPFAARAQMMLDESTTHEEWQHALDFADLVEEFAVSLWAQELGTLRSVSAPKLERAASQWKVRAIHASSS